MIATIVVIMLLTLYLWYQIFFTQASNDIFILNDIIPTTEYFDWNVNQMPIFDVKYIDNDLGTACPASNLAKKITWKKYTNIYTWRGSVEGCVENGMYSIGKCRKDTVTPGKKIA